MIDYDQILQELIIFRNIISHFYIMCMYTRLNFWYQHLNARQPNEQWISPSGFQCDSDLTDKQFLQTTQADKKFKKNNIFVGFFRQVRFFPFKIQ
jgi:hypothetical protein